VVGDELKKKKKGGGGVHNTRQKTTGECILVHRCTCMGKGKKGGCDQETKKQKKIGKPKGNQSELTTKNGKKKKKKYREGTMARLGGDTRRRCRGEKKKKKTFPTDKQCGRRGGTYLVHRYPKVGKNEITKCPPPPTKKTKKTMRSPRWGFVARWNLCREKNNVGRQRTGKKPTTKTKNADECGGVPQGAKKGGPPTSLCRKGGQTNWGRNQKSVLVGET